MDKHKSNLTCIPVALDALFWYSIFQDASDVLNANWGGRKQEVKISVDGYDEAECIEKESWIRFQELVETYKVYTMEGLWNS